MNSLSTALQSGQLQLDSWTLRMGLIGCPETSARNYHYSLRNNSEEHSSQLLLDGSLKSCNWHNFSSSEIQSDSFGTRPKKMRISQRLFIRFWTCTYDYIPCFMKSMSILEEKLEMFATTLQAEVNETLHVCENGLQDVLTNRSNFTSNVVFQFLYGTWLVGISFSF